MNNRDTIKKRQHEGEFIQPDKERAPLAEQFAQLVEEARRDPHIVALWLDGSRGKGVKVTEHSDYDVRMIVTDGVLDVYQTKYEHLGHSGLDLSVMAFTDFVSYADFGTEEEWDVDVICLAVGFSPMVELAGMLGCRFEYVPELGGYIPVHDRNMETDVSGIYIAGDMAGVEDASIAMEEGKLAGVAVAEKLGYLIPREARARKEELWESIQCLRKGPFGEAKYIAKERILL